MYRILLPAYLPPLEKNVPKKKRYGTFRYSKTTNN